MISGKLPKYSKGISKTISRKTRDHFNSDLTEYLHIGTIGVVNKSEKYVNTQKKMHVHFNPIINSPIQHSKLIKLYIRIRSIQE